MAVWKAPHAIGKIVARNDDPDRLSELMSRSTGTVSYSRPEGSLAFDHSVEVGTIGDLHIWTSSTATGFVARSQQPRARRMEIHFVEHGQYQSVTRFQSITANAGTAFLLYDTSEHTAQAAQNTRLTTLSIPFDRYRGLVALETDDPREHLRRKEPILPMKHPVVGIIADLASQLQARGADDNPFHSAPLVASILEEALLQALATGWPEKVEEESRQSPPASRYLRRALDRIHSGLHTRMTLEEIAAAAGIGPRMLQTLFRKELGMTPIQYVIKARLQVTHREIVDSNNNRTIADIARGWGFTHLGDFDRRYKAFYGVTPSAARRSARR